MGIKVIKVVGLDVGEITGVTVFHIADNKLVNFELFETPPADKNEYFIFNIAKFSEEILKIISPDFTVFEGYAYGGRGFFNVKQAELQGQIKRFLVDSKFPFCEAHISAMKLVVLGKGNAVKKDAHKFGLKLFKDAFNVDLKIKSKHIFDSMIPAYLGYKYLVKELTEEQEKIIKESIIGG